MNKNNKVLNEQKNILLFFKKACTNNRLANCFVFINNNEEKTDSLIKEVIPLIINNNNNKFKNVITFDDENVLNKNNINNVIEFCNLKTTEKIIIYIKKIDYVGEAVANSLLKLMENLNNYYILMSCIEEKNVLDTIMSRSQKIYLNDNNILSHELDVDQDNYQLIYKNIVGLIINLSNKHFLKYTFFKNELISLARVLDNQIIIFESLIKLLNKRLVFKLKDQKLNKSFDLHGQSTWSSMLKNLLNLYADFKKENQKLIFFINIFIILEEGIT